MLYDLYSKVINKYNETLDNLEKEQVKIVFELEQPFETYQQYEFIKVNKCIVNGHKIYLTNDTDYVKFEHLVLWRKCLILDEINKQL